MGNNSNSDTKSRRWFLSLFTPKSNATTGSGKVKMLTPDGKLVEVDKAILDKLTSQKKASNQQIYDWMENPSKENNI
ncbi:MAG: hypothetical protein NTX08_10520 [Sphingobacteriales bacterium]|jgi:hypothetical protein|nr:hypothetical protein [Sphingobacteriales bacterium]